VRRVWIPKPGKAERRPLGIPPMIERCKQALAKLALEPQWEAKFEPNSYGFGPGRSCHDAKEAIFKAIKGKPKFVFDADIKAWLKAGVMEGGSFSPTEAGTPQGGVSTPPTMLQKRC
jgi:RNA-directed DNA polymerase